MNRAQRRHQSKQIQPDSKVKIIVGRPPVWDSIVALLGAEPRNAVFTYGDTIYNPAGTQLTFDVIEHEKIHMAQQDYCDTGAALWWGKFLRDVEFRIEQEARAYARQYAALSQQYTGYEIRNKVLADLARKLSGPLYNHSITHAAAMGKIREYSGVK